MVNVSEHDLKTILALLEKHVPECEVRAFGSRVTWTAKDHSDLDLVVVGPAKLEMRRIWALKEAFDESALPFVVDVMDWNNISVEFHKNIEKLFYVLKKPSSKSKNGWQYYKVADFAEVIGGGTPKTEVAEYWNGGIPWITPKDLSNHQSRYISNGERSISKEGLKNSSARVVPSHTVLLTSRAPVGYLAIAQNEVATNQGFRNLIVKKGFSPEFIYYLLLNNVDYLKQHASGSTFQELSGGTLKNLEFKLPDYATQEEIARILGELDEKIELNRKMNETLENMARAIFKSWFIDFDPVRAKIAGKITGLPKEISDIFPSRLVDSELGEIPEGWEVWKIKDIAERVAMGPFGSSIKVDTFVDEGIPVISGQHLRGFMVEDSDFNYVTIEHADKLKNANVKPGDVVFTHAGNIGQVAYVPENGKFPRYIISQRQFYLRCNLSHVSPSFMVFYFKSTEGQHRLLANASSSGVPSIAQPVTYLRSIPLVIPPKTTMDMFDESLRPILRHFETIRNESRMLASLRDSLLPKLMSGEILVAING